MNNIKSFNIILEKFKILEKINLLITNLNDEYIIEKNEKFEIKGNLNKKLHFI